MNPVFIDGVVKKFNGSVDGKSYTVEWHGGTSSSSLWSESEVAWGILLSDSIGQEISKEFGADGTFSGRVVDVSSGENQKEDELYRIVYEDGDTEDFDKADLEKGRKLHQKLATKSESIGLEISKEFGADGIFSGRVVDVSGGDDQEDDVLYRVVYEDGDTEDFDKADFEKGRKLHQRLAKKQTSKRKQAEVFAKKEGTEDIKGEEDCESNGGRRRGSRGRVNYVEPDKDSMELDSDEEEVRQTPKRLKSSRNRKKIVSPKDDDYEDLEEVESDSDLPEDMIVDDDDDDDDNFEEVVKTKPWPSNKKSKVSAKKGKKAKKSGAEEDKNVVDDEFEDRLRTERKRVKPNNNPQKFLAAGSYVDPVGVDPTHGIVERIVSDQVRKVGRLLQKVQTQENRNRKDDGVNSELSYPIRLQTACSGTDAPSIALGLIKESLSRLCSKSDENEKHAFDYEHKMSCEIEPFKQAYIARNFPGVPLFPDITKLSSIDDDGKGEKVVDVYGRPQFIPEGDLFVAGTSCKDFSMLKTTRRKDIQDKGQSGETFLAAVEFLDLYQPPFAIFENVDGAPWGKMQEYIQGRINLVDRNVNKAIASTKRKDSKFDQFWLCLPRQSWLYGNRVIEHTTHWCTPADN